MEKLRVEIVQLAEILKNDPEWPQEFCSPTWSTLHRSLEEVASLHSLVTQLRGRHHHDRTEEISSPTWFPLDQRVEVGSQSEEMTQHSEVVTPPPLNTALVPLEEGNPALYSKIWATTVEQIKAISVRLLDYGLVLILTKK